MQIEITKDSEKLLVDLYKVYLDRRKAQQSKQEAHRFEDGFFETEKPFSKMHPDDVTDSRLELGQANLLTNYIGGDCELTTTAIIYLENRFKNNLTDVLSFLSQFVP